MTRVLVADDFPLVREALAAALARHPEIEVVGLAGDGVEALELAHAHQPDVVVLDLRMPRMSGLVALTRLTAELPCTRVLLLTACEEPDTVIDAVSAGAAGFVTKRTSGAELAEAVLAVSRGEPVVSPALTAHLVMTEAVCDDAFLARIEGDLHTLFGIEHTTIQVETGDPAYPCRCRLAPS